MFWFFSAAFVWNISLSKKSFARHDHIYIYIYISSCKVFVFLVRFKWNLNFLERCYKNNQISKFWKFVQWDLSYSSRTDERAGGQTEMTKLRVACRNFSNPSKTYLKFAVYQLVRLPHVRSVVSHLSYVCLVSKWPSCNGGSHHHVLSHFTFM